MVCISFPGALYTAGRPKTDQNIMAITEVSKELLLLVSRQMVWEAREDGQGERGHRWKGKARRPLVDGRGSRSTSSVVPRHHEGWI